jgi:hypothetical protein
VFSASIADMHMPIKSLLRRIDPAKSDDLRKVIVNTPLERLSASALRGERSAALTQDIRRESVRLVELLRASGAAVQLPSSDLQDIVIVGTSYMDRSRKDCIVLQNEELLRTSKFTNVSGTQDAFDIVKAVGFVMSDLEWAPFVLLAARSVLGQPHGQPKPAELPPSRPGSGLDPIEITIVERMILDLKGVLRRAGVPRAKFDPVIEAATRAGYFDAAPLFSRPVDAQSAPVKAIADRLAAFDGQRSWQVRPETVAAFVNQLPPKLREPMLARLNEVELLDEQVIAESLLSH